MKYSSLFAIFMMMMSEKMFVIGVFFFGCSLGYSLFEIFKYNNKKDEIDGFFSNFSKKYDSSYWCNYETIIRY